MKLCVCVGGIVCKGWLAPALEVRSLEGVALVWRAQLVSDKVRAAFEARQLERHRVVLVLGSVVFYGV